MNMGMFSLNADASESPHILGGSLGYGSQELKAKSGDYDAGDSFTSDLYYRYMLNEHFGIEAGYFAGTGGVVSAFVDIIGDIKNLSYKGVRGAVYGEYALSSGNSLYAKVGTAYSQVSYEVGDQERDSNDMGFYGATGWQYRFKSGLGLNFEYQYVPMDELQLQGVSFGMSYRF
nr:porin family protein [Shewanella sp. HN-41]